jgi:hypothetical protein
MDQNPFNPPVGGQTPEPPAGPLIRTMSKDIETLSKNPQKEEAAFQSPGYEPPPEMPLGMAPPPPPGGESMAGGPSSEIPVPPAAGMPPPTTPAPTAPPQLAEIVISEKALTEFAPPQPPKKDVKKLAIIAGIAGLGLIFGLAGWSLYPKIFPASTPLPTPAIIIPTPVIETPIPTPTPEAVPMVFFMKTPAKTAVLDIAAQTKAEFIAAIKQEVEQIETVGTLKVIDLRQNGEPLSFKQFADIFGLNFPEELKPNITDEFKLFANYHAQEGSQLGLIVNLFDGTAAPTALINWENSMTADLNELFLEKNPGAPTEFKDGLYRGITKRFLSFSNPPFSIDYGISGNFLVIATSRFSFANAIDHILGE